jgi:hypothetical protein
MDAECWVVSKLHNITAWEDVLVILIAVEPNILHERCLFNVLKVNHSAGIQGTVLKGSQKYAD